MGVEGREEQVSSVWFGRVLWEGGTQLGSTIPKPWQDSTYTQIQDFILVFGYLKFTYRKDSVPSRFPRYLKLFYLLRCLTSVFWLCLTNQHAENCIRYLFICLFRYLNTFWKYYLMNCTTIRLWLSATTTPKSYERENRLLQIPGRSMGTLNALSQVIKCMYSNCSMLLAFIWENVLSLSLSLRSWNLTALKMSSHFEKTANHVVPYWILALYKFNQVLYTSGLCNTACLRKVCILSLPIDKEINRNRTNPLDIRAQALG